MADLSSVGDILSMTSSSSRKAGAGDCKKTAGNCSKTCSSGRINCGRRRAALIISSAILPNCSSGKNAPLNWKRSLRESSRRQIMPPPKGCSSWKIPSQNLKKIRTYFPGHLPFPGRHAFEDELVAMLEDAKFEIVIVSPWIKRQTWNRMKGPLRKFSRGGGKLRVFMRGSESDYSLGLSDNLQEEVTELGGEVVLVAKLHAKIYMVDRKEAIVTSANLTKGGTEANYEGGIWVNDPVVLKEICEFVDDIYQIGAR